MTKDINIRLIACNDFDLIEASFKAQGWNKSATQFEEYFKQQQENQRVVFLAFFAGNFSGYGTVKWVSDYLPFKQMNVPEISDLNVLKKYQGLGIGRALIEMAEQVIFENHKISGIGVGLLPDYGAAQRLYFKLGYKPDGFGITYQNQRCQYGSNVIIDDDLVLWMTKSLKN